MNGYLNYKDIMDILSVGKNKAYEIITDIRETTNFGETYEGKMIGGKRVPVKHFKQAFPNAVVPESKE